MTWGLLLVLAAVVFCNRYLLLEPRLPLRFPDRLKRSLNYSAPCLLSAVAAPIVFEQSQALSLNAWNQPYLWGALACIALAYWLKNTLLVIVLSLLVFYALVYMQ